MTEIKVKIIYAQNFKLTFDKGFDVLFAVEKRRSKFVRQHKTVARVAHDKTVMKRRLAGTVMIAVRRVEIIKTLIQKIVDHAAKLVVIYFAVLHRKAHAAESEILFYFLKIIIHDKLSLFLV